MANRQLKNFDVYAAEVARDDLELPLPDGTTLIIKKPTAKQAREFGQAQRLGSQDRAVRALFGVEQGNKLIALLDDKPADLLMTIMDDAAKEWGIPAGELWA